MKLIPFHEKLKEQSLEGLHRSSMATLQVNIGKLCNQACHHCHVEAGPKRTEIMNLETTERILKLIAEGDSISTVDITGGAPEMMPHFKLLVSEVRKMGLEVIDRCNISVLFEPGQEETAQFLADQKVQIVASLPCYSKENVDKQRGRGVFDKSIEGLKALNNLGYAQPNSDLQLHLVYNPGGAFLPPEQKPLEAAYKKELNELFGIQFNSLFTITNLPIKRFLVDLKRQDKEQEYMQTLIASYNPEAAKAVMCRSQLSVGWDGKIYDCDFNQMLEMADGGGLKDIWSIESFSEAIGKPISLANHCYSCTAGAGSSCGGALV